MLLYYDAHPSYEYRHMLSILQVAAPKISPRKRRAPSSAPSQPAFPKAPTGGLLSAKSNPDLELTCLSYSANGSYVSEHFSNTEVTAIVVARASTYPCPTRNFRVSLNKYIQGTAASTPDVPQSVDDLKNFGHLLCTGSGTGSQGTNELP